MDHGLVGLQEFQGCFAGHRLDAPDAGTDGPLGDDLHDADLAGVGHVGAAAEFGGEAGNLHHPDHVAVLFAEEGHGSGGQGLLDVHLLHLGVHGFQSLAGHEPFDLRDLFRLEGGEVGEVEAQAGGVHHAAGLFHVSAEHLAQGRMQQVGGRVVGPHPAAADGVDQGVHGHVLHQGALHADLVEMAPLGRGDAVEDLRVAALEAQLARVSHLPAGLGVEGGAVQQSVAFATELFHPAVVGVEESHHVPLAFQVLVAGEAGGGEVGQHSQVPRQPQVVGLHGRPGAGALGAQFLLEARQIGGDAALATPVLHQVHGEPVGVVEAEDVAAG